MVISDLNNKPVKSFAGDKTAISPGETKILKASSLVNGLNFWSWGYGYLYNVQTILKIGGKPVDVLNTKTGFRKTAFRDGMILISVVRGAVSCPNTNR